ncbi:uridine diphosphate-N-acetylglucosamine-binding protein YvcK [Thalassotalea aquiviva]|uniref:gluconeogenesis factor YvcK family protein n=1 Tax=Thalassotalea aquiviva TaxID=3242415 RepID=UPI00352AFEE5
MHIKQSKVVAIGGGHGLGRILSTLSFLGDQLTGIVATTDNGGSTGKLRKRSSSIAWGDLRNCLTQLVEEDSVGSKLLNFRFDDTDELAGHNLGNLILYALNEIHSKPMQSISLIRQMLRVKTSVHPMSVKPTDLLAFYKEGRYKVGEMSVDDMPEMPKSLMLAPLVKALPETIKAILEADIIILGPGSFLTSIVPPLLVRDISNAIAKSKAHCVFIDNLAKENSPAGKLSLDQKLQWLSYNVGNQLIDTIITEQEDAQSEYANIINAPLSSAKDKGFHDQDKLISALELALSEHFERKALVSNV